MRKGAAYLCPGMLLLAVAAMLSGDLPYREAAEPYPGSGTAVAYVVLSGVTWAAGALVLGGIVIVAVSSCPDRWGLLSASTYLVQRTVVASAALWFVGSVVTVPMSVAASSGVPVVKLIRPGIVFEVLPAVEEAYAWIVSAVCAAVVFLVTSPWPRWNPTVLAAIPACIGLMAVPLTGNVAQGPDHDIATTLAFGVYVPLAVLIGVRSLVGLRGMVRRTDADVTADTRARRRVVMVSLLAETVCLAAGLVLVLWLLAPGALLTESVYGRCCLAGGIVLVILMIADVRELRCGGAEITRLWSVFSCVGVAALVLVAAMVRLYTAPVLPRHEFSIWDVYLGYELPDPPSVLRLIGVVRFDFFLGTASLVLAALYLWGYLHLRRRGVHWPLNKLLWWLGGCVGLLMGTSSGLATYSSAMMSVHMGNHMLLNMYASVMLVLGSPVTLALRALPAMSRRQGLTGPREWVTSLMKAGFSRVVTHPAFTFIVFVASLYVVYFTPLWGMFAKYHWWHLFITIHFTVSGYLFFWTIIGDDPGPRELPHIARLGILLGAMPFHAFFGIAMMSLDSTIAADFYDRLRFDWLADRLHDQWVGGAIAWGMSEIPILIVAIALGVQWFRSDQRAAKRLDRWEDAGKTDDLDAYNRMLHEMKSSR